MTTIKKYAKNHQLLDKRFSMPKREIRNVIFMGRKPLAVKALKYLLAKGVNVKAVVAQNNEPFDDNLASFALAQGTPIYSDIGEVYKLVDRGDERFTDIDLIISYLFWKRIKTPLIKLARHGCVNFHPAPLPDYKGRAGYNTAILDRRSDFGVSAHFIDSEEFDAGPIIQVARFDIDHQTETAISLEKKSQIKLLELFKEVVDLLMSAEEIKTLPNSGGLYITGSQLEAMKVVDLAKDSPEEIDRKVRAFFFPPYTGAKLVVGGREFTLINEDILKLIHEKINQTISHS